MIICINLRSFFKGIWHMRWPHAKVNYGIDWMVRRDRRDYTWVHLWTPIYHEGRGPYISVGIYLGIGTLRFCREY